MKLPIYLDNRGSFVKSFHAPKLASEGLCDHFEEDFFSVSRQGVLRGFHVMAPPAQGAKLVYVIQGRILDAILDLRRSSATYGKHQLFELDAEQGEALLLAPGIAHAFLSISDAVIVGYKTERSHDPNCDIGVRWDSTPVVWPVNNPVLSDRDGRLPSLDKFESPFI